MILTDLFKKKTDRNQYLLTSSCHPSATKENIPFSLALRIVRICSLPKDREKRFQELKEMLIDRDYKPRLITAAIDKARSVPREEAIKKVVRPVSSDRPVLVIQFDPRLPSLSGIVQKHWRSMVSTDPYLKQVFPLPPLIAYRRPKNIRDLVIKARIPPVYIRPTRTQAGYKKCTNVSCLTCPYSKPGKLIKATASEFKTEVNTSFNCNCGSHSTLMKWTQYKSRNILLKNLN